MPNNHSTEYELNSTSHETCKSFNFNDPRIIDGINDTSGTNFARIEESTRHLFVPWRGCTARNPEIIAIWFILMRSIVEEKRQELKKGKSFDFLEERERDKNEIHGYWKMTLAPSKRNSFLRGIAKRFITPSNIWKKRKFVIFKNNYDFYRSIIWNSRL